MTFLRLSLLSSIIFTPLSCSYMWKENINRQIPFDKYVKDIKKTYNIKDEIHIVKSSCQSMGIMAPDFYLNKKTNSLHICNINALLNFSESQIKAHLIKEILIHYDLCKEDRHFKVCKNLRLDLNREVASHRFSAQTVFTLKVYFGDKKSQFKYIKSKQHKLTYQSNYGDNSLTKLEKDDVYYLMGKVRNLSGRSKLPKECPRHLITLETKKSGKKKKIYACFDGLFKNSKRLVRFAKILSIYPQLN